MSSSNNMTSLVNPSRLSATTETRKGSHEWVLRDYSLVKGIGVGKHIASDTFTAGRHQWAIYFYPDGKNDGETNYVGIYVTLASGGYVQALFELTLVDQSDNEKHKVYNQSNKSIVTLKYCGSMWGYRCFLRRDLLEKSDFLKDDCLKIKCTVEVVVPPVRRSGLHSSILEVGETDVDSGDGMLLGNEESSDVTFHVAGDTFHAHKLVLASRAPVFWSKVSDKKEKNRHDIVIADVEPTIFKAVLHFIYQHTLIRDIDEVRCTVSSVSESSLAKLLAAADNYGLEKLKLLCESRLWTNLSVDNVAEILALANQNQAKKLKAVCLRFAAGNLAAVMRSDGFVYLGQNFPDLEAEVLEIGCEELDKFLL